MDIRLPNEISIQIIIKVDLSIIFKTMEAKEPFTSTKNWSWTLNDQKASAGFNKLIDESRKVLPNNFFTHEPLGHYDEAAKSELYGFLKTIPKGVLHHNHLDCNEDIEFYRKYIASNPRVFVSQAQDRFEVGSENQAAQNGWVSMQELRKKFGNQDDFCKFLLNQTTFNTKEMAKYSATRESWPLFEAKIMNFLTLIEDVDIMRDYFKHVCEKHIQTGYERIQQRFLLRQLKERDANGNEVKLHGYQKFKEVCDQAIALATKNHPEFTVGFIAFGLKVFPPEQNEEMLTKALELNWDKLVGIDFVQEEDPYGSLKPYDEVSDKVLAKFPGTKVKKVYHAGETNDYTNNNVQIAIEGGSVRIGHGINIVQKAYLQEVIKKDVCFQINPVSNLFMGYSLDSRKGHAPTLMNLGIPVSLSSDDPGKFNCEDSTMDYWLAIISYDWGLKQLKLCAVHSVNHAICSEELKAQMIKNFIKNWDLWIERYLKK